MNDDAKNIILSDVADIRPGYPIRGAVEETPDGTTAVVQIKNVGVETGIDWPAAVKTTLTGRRKPDWLQAGDILFSARGNRNVAVCVKEPPTEAVCSPHFFLVRIKNGNAALPEFVTWLINQPDAQRYFSQSATGSYITNIRRNVLEETPLVLPSIENQKIIVQLNKAAQREKEIMQKLIDNRRQQLNFIAITLID